MYGTNSSMTMEPFGFNVTPPRAGDVPRCSVEEMSRYMLQRHPATGGGCTTDDTY